MIERQSPEPTQHARMGNRCYPSTQEAMMQCLGACGSTGIEGPMLPHVANASVVQAAASPHRQMVKNNSGAVAPHAYPHQDNRAAIKTAVKGGMQFSRQERLTSPAAHTVIMMIDAEWSQSCKLATLLSTS